jgi:hypothetical protein
VRKKVRAVIETEQPDHSNERSEPMTTTLVTSLLLDRARSVSGAQDHAASSPHASASVRACAPTPAAAVEAFPAAIALATTMTHDMNLWLGGDVRSKGFGSDYATKRITPGRLEGMT